MDAAQLNDVSLSGSVAASTLRENILAELEMNPNPDWGYLLKHLTMAFKQLETMKSDVHPSFQLVDVVPQSAAIPTIADLLGTAISAEDKAALSSEQSTAAAAAPAGGYVTDEDITRHNSAIQDLLESIMGPSSG